MLKKLVIPSAALAAAIVLTTPQESHGFVVIPGRVLGLGQMDYRIFNNFQDNASNNNTNEINNFPGHTGAVLALWKGAYEWCSEPRGGTGNGDPHQGILGSGNSNFDGMFTGLATSAGSTFGGSNVIAALDQDGGGTLAFMQPSSGDSWQIRFYDSWTWADGPGTFIGNAFDLQGVGCHEYGHALGLSHSQFGGQTMTSGSAPGQVSKRSLAFDDVDGVQSIYGTKAANKPRILSATNLGGFVEIECENLDPTGNEVWFTRLNPNSANSPGTAIKVTNAPSTNGGTMITVAIPSTAGPGEVLVKRPGNGQASVSAPWPFDPLAVPPPVPMISSISKGTVVPLTPNGSPDTVSIFGSNLTSITDLTVNGDELDNGQTFSGSYTIVDDGQIDIEMPLASVAGLVDIEISGPGGTDSIQVDIVPVSTPTIGSLEGEIIQADGINFASSAQFGDIVLLLVSGFGTPTTIPNVIDLELGGGNINAIFKIKTWNIGPKLWRKQGYGPFTGLPTGIDLFYEGWVFEAANNYEAPWSSTNLLTIPING